MAAAETNCSTNLGNEDPYKYKYKMNHKHRGKALIFIHIDYDRKLDLQRRDGSETDVGRLDECFSYLGFRVEKYTDLKVNDIQNVLTKVSKEDHTDHDCLAVIVLTHGTEGRLFAYDNSYPEEKLWSPFTSDKCSTLIGKPKLFFIQACRGLQRDSGVTMPVAEESKSKVFLEPLENVAHENVDQVAGSKIIDLETDFLVAFSTVYGYVSWKKGGQISWFIEKLCEELKLQRDPSDHLLIKLTYVNQFIAIDYHSRQIKRQDSHSNYSYKQSPCVVHRLKKLLYL